MEKEDLHSKLCDWFGANGRRLPWRLTTDPYAITVSEFMLQQTRVTAVVPFFDRWMRRFPTVKSLAEASEQEVLAHWQGLGYYSRARNLHALSHTLMEKFSGEFPSAPEELTALPGIGIYTASAIRAFAFDLPAPVVDANIARVLARWFDYRQPIDTAAGKHFLSEHALALQPESSPRIWNSAIMELGALLCVSNTPDCLMCPVRIHCKAKNPASLPKKKPRAVTTKLKEQRALIVHEGSIWLEYSTGPRWRGLWLLPLLGKTAGKAAPVATLTYPITRYQITMELFHRPRPAGSTLKAHPISRLAHLPMPSPHRRAVALGLETVQNQYLWQV